MLRQEPDAFQNQVRAILYIRCPFRRGSPRYGNHDRSRVLWLILEDHRLEPRAPGV